jgi:hypothetical protein
MATILVVLTCAAADSFLVYILFQFTRELRKGRHARKAAAVPLLIQTSAEAGRHRAHRKVIDITSLGNDSSKNPSRRRAS